MINVDFLLTFNTVYLKNMLADLKLNPQKRTNAGQIFSGSYFFSIHLLTFLGKFFSVRVGLHGF